LLKERAKATAQVRWTGESSWTPLQQRDNRRRTSDDRAELASLLSGSNVDACAFADVTPLSKSNEWVRRGTDEFISIASFNRFSLDLLRFGAPANLVEAAQKAAIEEIGHAKLSFAVASRLSADQTVVPEPNLVVPDHLPLSSSVVEMATHAVKEACLGEFMAAVQAQVELQCVVAVHRKHCSESSNAGCASLEQMLHVLRTVLTEETTHASLAFETVRWVAARDTTSRDAIRAAFQELLETGQTRASTAVLNEVIKPWFDGLPVTKVSDAALAPVLRNAIEGMVRALQLRRVSVAEVRKD